jgi:hypothetical protein
MRVGVGGVTSSGETKDRGQRTEDRFALSPLTFVLHSSTGCGGAGPVGGLA